uniref:Uncharacterized protein n=1 Tax=Nelumbo nucifera TaxID=4432 RepID=A0A822YMH7_NELNU|nr:TPA_asm: hypothetical protein HUJ06_012661 [Nelumbo nucifera]
MGETSRIHPTSVYVSSSESDYQEETSTWRASLALRVTFGRVMLYFLAVTARTGLRVPRLMSRATKTGQVFTSDQAKPKIQPSGVLGKLLDCPLPEFITNKMKVSYEDEANRGLFSTLERD